MAFAKPGRIYIPHPLYEGHVADAPAMYRLLELREGQKLPREGMPPRKIHDITVYVKPIGLATFKLNPLSKHVVRRQGHRVMAICPLCDKHISVGRLHQHVCPKLEDDSAMEESFQRQIVRRVL